MKAHALTTVQSMSPWHCVYGWTGVCRLTDAWSGGSHFSLIRIYRQWRNRDHYQSMNLSYLQERHIHLILDTYITLMFSSCLSGTLNPHGKIHVLFIFHPMRVKSPLISTFFFPIGPWVIGYPLIRCLFSLCSWDQKVASSVVWSQSLHAPIKTKTHLLVGRAKPWETGRRWAANINMTSRKV